MIQHWVLTSPHGPTPDKPHVLLRTEDGVRPQLWAPTEDKWVDAPVYFDAIYGGDPDSVPVTVEQADQYKADGVGHDAEGLAALLEWNEQWRKSSAEPAETPA